MTNKGKRNAVGGIFQGEINNLMSYSKGYLACGQQAAEVIKVLRSLPNGSFEDDWTFEFEATPIADFHVWGRATSKNQANPDIVFDPQKDTIYCEPHGGYGGIIKWRRY